MTMHSCPHCGASARYRSVWASSPKRPYACPTCHGKSWYTQPFGLGIAELAVFAAGTFASNHYLSAMQAAVVVMGLAFALLCAQLFITSRFGALKPIAGSVP